METQAVPQTFTPYQKRVVALLALLQFTVVLDFMILSPLGAILMPTLSISPKQFGVVVSAYGFAAGVSGFIAAGFADSFDRKRFLLFFYSGFVAATLFCGLAPTYELLLAARVLTGCFGGVVGGIVFAITTDLFPLQMRGRVMGTVQAAFAASQVLGLPLGLFLANTWGWHSAFLMIVVVALGVVALIAFGLEPVNAHVGNTAKTPAAAFAHLGATVSTPRYLQGFATTALLATGGFMLMPFAADFAVHNMKLDIKLLPLLYVLVGICNFISGPLIGRAADHVGKFRVFLIGSVVTSIMCIVYTHRGETGIALAVAISALMFMGVQARMISSQALMSAIPTPSMRGSYMAVSSCTQYIAGGIATWLAGIIVVRGPTGAIERFPIVAWVIIGATAITCALMYILQRSLPDPRVATPSAAAPERPDARETA
jgi:predicted MFS family arabinose efflux permease